MDWKYWGLTAQYWGHLYTWSILEPDGKELDILVGICIYILHSLHRRIYIKERKNMCQRWPSMIHWRLAGMHPIVLWTFYTCQFWSGMVWDGLGRSQGSSYSSCTNRFNRPSFRSNDSTLQLEDPLLNPYEILLNRHDTSDSSPKKTAPQRWTQARAPAPAARLDIWHLLRAKYIAKTCQSI